MKAKELLDAGQLGAAIAELNEAVKAKPADIRLRTFLFELLCFSGDYDRAQRQLDVIGSQSEQAGIGVEVYRGLIRAETARSRLFSQGLKPSFLFEAPASIQLNLDALNRLREGQSSEAKALLQRSDERRPPISGKIGGQSFSRFRDYDDLLSPVLEVYAKDTYVWLPFEQIRKITIPQPKHLRDLLWAPATIEAGAGPPGEVFLPVLYAGSHQEENDQVRLGKVTEWKDLGEGLARGVGHRTFLVDQDERGLLEAREIEFDAQASEG